MNSSYFSIFVDQALAGIYFSQLEDSTISCKHCAGLAGTASLATSSLLPRCWFSLMPAAVCSVALTCGARSPESGVVLLSVMKLCLNKLCYCRNPLPPLFMRFTLQTLNAAPRLKGFLLDILSNLVNKQVWQLHLLSLLLNSAVLHTVWYVNVQSSSSCAQVLQASALLSLFTPKFKHLLYSGL